MLDSKRYKTINTLKLDLYLKEKLTTVDFNLPLDEYIFLDGDTIKMNSMNGIIDYDFNWFKDSYFYKFSY